VRYGCEFVAFAQDAAGVRAKVKTRTAVSELVGHYLVGCDGGSSGVRRQLGIKLSGDTCCNCGRRSTAAATCWVLTANYAPVYSNVMPGFMPGIHVFLGSSKTWMAGT
jgi:2-polyprenyl-6-methoxyphenol hydroxylase-like FAD-dependent oxidoreductase